jgi:DNA-binding response OmpR family regulator
MTQSRTVLIVDDSEFDRSLLVRVLEKNGNFNTLQTNSGEECLEILRTQKVHLILLDIMMPGSSGTQTLESIRKNFNPIELPVIMITAKSDALDVIDALRRGANDYITKPVNFEVALSRISTHLKLAEVSEEMAKLKEMSTLDAIITTYNHEINNPLAIAVSCLSFADLNSPECKDKLSKSLWRIADIVKRIKAVSEQKNVEYQSYVGNNRMLKIK